MAKKKVDSESRLRHTRWLTQLQIDAYNIIAHRENKQSNNKKLNDWMEKYLFIVKNEKFPCDHLTICTLHTVQIFVFYYFSKHKKAFWYWSDAMNGKHLFVVYSQMDLKKKKTLPNRMYMYVRILQWHEHEVYCYFAITGTINAYLIVNGKW